MASKTSSRAVVCGSLHVFDQPGFETSRSYMQAYNIESVQDGNDPQPPLHMGLRNQSHPSFGSLNTGPLPEGEYEWRRSQQWDGNSGLGPMLSQCAPLFPSLMV